MEIAYTSLNSLAHSVWLVAKGAKLGRQMCEVGSPKVRAVVAKGAKLVADSAFGREVQKCCTWEAC